MSPSITQSLLDNTHWSNHAINVVSDYLDNHSIVDDLKIMRDRYNNLLQLNMLFGGCNADPYIPTTERPLFKHFSKMLKFESNLRLTNLRDLALLDEIQTNYQNELDNCEDEDVDNFMTFEEYTIDYFYSCIQVYTFDCLYNYFPGNVRNYQKQVLKNNRVRYKPIHRYIDDQVITV